MTRKLLLKVFDMQYFNRDSLKRVAQEGMPKLNNVVGPMAGDIVWQQESLPIASSKIRSLEAVGLTHAGFVRVRNEDCFYLKTQPVHHQLTEEQSVQGVFVLCDGIGGYEQGDVASSMATFRLAQDLLGHGYPEFTADISLKSSIYKVNQDIYQENQRLKQLGLGTMGTTAVAATLQDQEVSIVHIGDSRCYRITESKGLEQLTLDHERGQSHIAQGLSSQDAYAELDAYYLTQALGPAPNNRIAPDVNHLTIQENSLFLLCTDGLSDNDLVESFWQSHLMPYVSAERSLNEGIQNLLDLALQKNGHDNITILLFRVCLI
ncbi:MAG: SpoIIE family protein phosphatase [Acaryochloridaceae cyanobacterium RL_2_7]|nr:SpoIIE family protein phosphatase [Acaryochloridaceae cyanobacterium RL_2_7]